MSKPDWTRAIAALIDQQGTVRGTAFFVAPDAALTCDHVLAAAKGAVRLRALGSEVAEEVIDEDRDSELDLALVRVPSRADRHWVVLSPNAAVIGRRILSRGFPRDHTIRDYPDGFPMDPAVVSGDTTRVWRGSPVQMLVLADTSVQQGMSGAPAVDAETDTVVGVLRFAEKETGRALAIPAEAATRRWPGMATDQDQPTRARSFAELTPTIPEELVRSWDEFDLSTLHCIVVGSETLASISPEGQLAADGGRESLAAVFNAVLSSPKARALWTSFADAWRERQLVRGSQRRLLSADYSKDQVQLAKFDVQDAYTNANAFDRAVRLIVEADLALFDVTGFEPGVMLLLGVRAATRRGVTICSHGGGWREGEPLARPFNLSDLALASHTPYADTLVGADQQVDRLVERIRTGFDQLARQPQYLDLPVFDALRRLGPQEDARSSIPLENEVLVLCSYDRKYFPTWKFLRARTQEALSDRGIFTNVARLLDIATPQLVSQSLYERIRRCAGCVADWTGSSPSTFFELGVRLAVSPWSAVQVADQDWLDAVDDSESMFSGGRRQLRRMRPLLSPLEYRGIGDRDIGERIARQLIEFREQIAGSAGHRLRQVAANAVATTEERVDELAEQLRGEADALNHQGRVRDNIPQALFYEVQEIKADQERAALERRLAAWLYLEHRVGAAVLPDSDARKRLWRELGEVVAADLFLSEDEADQSLALIITERLA